MLFRSERAKRPDEFLTPAPAVNGSEEDCPFCAGHEEKTLPEIMATRPEDSAPNSPGWSVRVIPSISPVLRIEGKLEHRARGVYDVTTGVGAHEMIVETPEHIDSIAQLPEEQIRRVIDTSIHRITDLEKDPRFNFVLLFKNYGPAAGEKKFRHSRSQLIALPANPIRLKAELNGARQYFESKERCIFCDILKQESDSKERIAFETAHFIALTPFASRFPFELWILPKEHSADFIRLPEDQRSDLARMFKTVLGKLSKTLDDPPYNYILHTAPFRRPRAGYWKTIQDDFHWHIEIMPRLTRVAGFEWGSGFYINPTAPEEAARFLREAEAPLPIHG